MKIGTVDLQQFEIHSEYLTSPVNANNPKTRRRMHLYTENFRDYKEILDEKKIKFSAFYFPSFLPDTLISCTC